MANELVYASLAGVLPALVWLWYWLREDRRSPEPKGLIARTFLLGMLATLIAIPMQKEVLKIFPELFITQIIIWAMLEEVLKLCAGYFGGLRSPEDNEPIDPLIYMITAALGFVAMENTLFVLSSIYKGDLISTIITGNTRFIGASLLHIVASGTIGAFLAFTFYKPRWVKTIFAIFGATFSILAHSLFNWSIMEFGDAGLGFAFIGTWVGVAALLLVFEMVKRVKRPPMARL